MILGLEQKKSNIDFKLTIKLNDSIVTRSQM